MLFYIHFSFFFTSKYFFYHRVFSHLLYDFVLLFNFDMVNTILFFLSLLPNIQQLIEIFFLLVFSASFTNSYPLSTCIVFILIACSMILSTTVGIPKMRAKTSPHFFCKLLSITFFYHCFYTTSSLLGKLQLPLYQDLKLIRL